MPHVKKARARHKILDECLRSRKCSMEFLMKKCQRILGISVSKRTLQYDIQYMRSAPPDGYGAPIVCERGLYFYSDREFSITKLPVNEDEINLLKQAVTALKNIKGLHLAEELEPVIHKLESRIETSYGREMNIIEFQSPVETLGQEHLGDLYKAIYNQNVLKIRYQSFRQKKPKEIILHPYLLKEFNDRWFLFGYDEQNRRVSNLALDRMKSIRVTNVPFIPNTFFTREDYFKNIIGVSVPEGKAVEQIVLWFSPERAPYIITKPLHHSQKQLAYNFRGLKIQLDVIPNRELVTLLLSFGKDMKVLKPESLAKEVADNLKKSLEDYR
ncbi:MAG TPA: WYL domain-containing protein [Chitinophagales bacterium]|nr:WYL domain-containing protein [Chitinophagales bacterium]